MNRLGDDHGFYDVRAIGFDGCRQITVNAGRKRTERTVPPAGEDYAYDHTEWDHEVTVFVSRTGRSVRVWLDGTEVHFPVKERT